jgi:hypothetical protein
VWGFAVPDFVSMTLTDGSQVLFQSEESDLVEMHSATAEVVPLNMAAGRLETIAKAAQQMCESLRTQMGPDEVQLEMGVAISGEMGWVFAKSTASGSLKVTLTWKASAP